jgi:hypothetical protein
MRKKVLLLSACLLFLITGCGLRASQKAYVVDFAAASSAVGKIASDELVSMRDDTITMNTHRIELIGLDPKYPGLDELHGKFKPEDSLVIFKAIDTLKTYGESLLAFAKDTQKDELTKASSNLITSIDSLPSNYVKVSKDQQDAIQQLVITGGGLIVEEMKEKAIKNIVTIYENQVTTLADLLSREFDESTDDSLAASFLATSSRSLVVSQEALKTCPDVLCRERAMRNYKESVANLDRGKLITKNVAKAIGELKKANTELVKAVQSDKIEIKDIKEFSATVKTLIDAVKLLRK